MKRRNIDNVKFRRNLKKTRLNEGFCAGSMVYLKILLVWAFVMMADFLLDFRFEYFWPTWLLLRSVYDSIRYQGAAFSAFFVCVTVTSDLVCFVFIPVQWLFFLASTYVWVQYVWHADRGICLPTVTLWLLYVYVEVSIRLRELKFVPFTLDLCRPFAAHCIGYPVVTLGFGVKSYVSYRLRLRKQREIARANDLYSQILQEALPSEQKLDVDFQKQEPELPNSDYVISNGAVVAVTANNGYNSKASIYSTINDSSLARRTSSASRYAKSSSSGGGSLPKNYRKTSSSGVGSANNGMIASANGHTLRAYDDDDDDEEDQELYEPPLPPSSSTFGWLNTCILRFLGLNSSAPPKSAYDVSTGALEPWAASAPAAASDGFFRDSDEESGESKDSIDDVNLIPTLSEYRNPLNNKKNNSYSAKVRGAKVRRRNICASATRNAAATLESNASALGGDAVLINNKDVNVAVEQKEKVQDIYLSLESDIEKLKNELRGSRAREQELRRQLNDLSVADKSSKNELNQCRQQNEQLQTKLQNLIRARQQDKQTVSTLEKRVCEEQRLKTQLEQQIQADKKQQKKIEESKNAAPTKLDCTDACKQRRREMEMQLAQIRRDYQQRDDQMSQMEQEIYALRQYKENNNSAMLMSALSSLQDKNRHLESSLSAETRIKLDLFSVLGDAKRQLEIAQTELAKKDQELDAARRRLQEILKVSPNQLVRCGPMPIDNNKVDALAAALCGAPSYTNSVGGLIYDDGLMATEYGSGRAGIGNQQANIVSGQNTEMAASLMLAPRTTSH